MARGLEGVPEGDGDEVRKPLIGRIEEQYGLVGGANSGETRGDEGTRVAIWVRKSWGARGTSQERTQREH